MKYSDSKFLQAVYELIGTLYVTEFRVARNPERAMAISAALVELGEDRSWASVWWAYGAINHDLRDQACERALVLLAKVEAPEQACAAALMLRAEIRFTQAIQSGDEPDQIEQAELLSEAVALAPDWPNLCARLARALHAAGDEQAARRHAMRAVALMEQAGPPEDPFDTAFTGTGLQSGWAAEELGALGLLR
ncbi:MAG: hypothetical protein U0R24_00860 [Solirubrobacterales bacterium]